MAAAVRRAAFNPRFLAAFVLLSTAVLLASLGGTAINLITGTETYPNVTQNDSIAWGHGDTIVVAYTDRRGASALPANNCGLSVSTNGGATFTRLASNPFAANGVCCFDRRNANRLTLFAAKASVFLP